MTYRYVGAGVMPEVPGVPMRDLTEEEYGRAYARLGSALDGVYRPDDDEAAVSDEPAPVEDDDETDEGEAE